MTLKQTFQLESIPCVFLHDILKRLLAKVFLMLHVSVCFDLLSFVSLLMIYAVERNVVVYFEDIVGNVFA